MNPAFPAFAAACARIGVSLNPDLFALLRDYTDLLVESNQHVNLVSRRDTGRILTYHIIDSLAASRFIPADSRVADIGTGAGLPGIPLAVTRPDSRFLLAESVRKKVEFLVLAVDRLRLTNARVIHDRAEDIPPLDCDVVLSRLTGPLRTTLPRLAEHCRPGGSIVLFKNPAAAESMPASLLRRLRLETAGEVDLRLPITDIRRRFVVLRPR